MRLKTPRILPVVYGEGSLAEREALEPYAARRLLLNVFTTLGRVPEALKAFGGWGRYVLFDSSLPARERELLILRVGWTCRAGYEWSQHVPMGRSAGLRMEELEGIKAGPGWSGWGEQDRLLLSAADELLASHFVTTPTWEGLAQCFSERQLMDIVFVVGHYTQVSMMLNSFGVQLDTGLRADPELEPS